MAWFVKWLALVSPQHHVESRAWYYLLVIDMLEIETRGSLCFLANNPSQELVNSLWVKEPVSQELDGIPRDHSQDYPLTSAYMPTHACSTPYTYGPTYTRLKNNKVLSSKNRVLDRHHSMRRWWCLSHFKSLKIKISKVGGEGMGRVEVGRGKSVNYVNTVVLMYDTV